MYIVIELAASTPMACTDEDGKTLTFNKPSEAHEYAHENCQSPLVVDVPPMAQAFIQQEIPMYIIAWDHPKGLSTYQRFEIVDGEDAM